MPKLVEVGEPNARAASFKRNRGTGKNQVFEITPIIRLSRFFLFNYPVSSGSQDLNIFSECKALLVITRV